MVEIFKALSEESRLRILSLIWDGELCVCEIESCLKMTQSNASRHLSVLKRCGILNSYKNAQWTYYRVHKDFIQENKELWDYLQQKLTKLPTFISDQETYRKFKAQELCNCSKEPH
ncbi:transcriptional regulator [Anaerocolumna cellulosilytica]|uniref:Transcriptional regulator n=1 Tax=Anaerocolumna cellulosilytica TaxID=433286 RepID=A0A6S6R081_9FIRM|nr:metalloregulator ArsR/SmtB family transcription factor [Anaerocolumna cellulosilytica]MBB5194076.1 ArsR family transcriptional regulator [Anaerocolumna cellulosilytica]BCJ94709.1 transcriptional regulator [Anaerocolumna cellulosilytica]